MVVYIVAVKRWYKILLLIYHENLSPVQAEHLTAGETTNKLSIFKMKNKTSRTQSMASAVSTAGSSASSLLYFICTETASLSRHAAQSAAGHQSSLHRVFAFGNIFLGRLQLLFSVNRMTPTHQRQSAPKQKKRTRQTSGRQQRNTNRERETCSPILWSLCPPQAQRCFCLRWEGSGFTSVKYYPPRPSPLHNISTIFESPMICHWRGRKGHFPFATGWMQTDIWWARYPQLIIAWN